MIRRRDGGPGAPSTRGRGSGSRGRRTTRWVGGPGCARAGRARRHGGRLPDGCSRRAWRRCSWCGSARCSGTPTSSRAMSGPSSSLSRSRRTSSSRSLSGSISGCFDGRSALGRDRRRPGVGARSSGRSALRRQLQQRRHGRAFVDEDADVALRLGQRQRASSGASAPGRRRARDGRAPAATRISMTLPLRPPSSAAASRRSRSSDRLTRSSRRRGPAFPGPGAPSRG